MAELNDVDTVASGQGSLDGTAGGGGQRQVIGGDPHRRVAGKASGTTRAEAAALPAAPASRTWSGGSGDWYDASQWTAAAGTGESFPLPGETALIASGTVTLLGAEARNSDGFDNQAVTLGEAGGAAAELDLNNTFIGNYFTVTTAGSAAIYATGITGFAGTLVAATAGATLTLGSHGAADGTLVVTNGAMIAISNTETLDLEGSIVFEAGAGVTAPDDVPVVNNATVTTLGDTNDFAGAVTGTGTFDLLFSTTLVLEGSVATGLTVTFGDVDGRLRLPQPSSFHAAITNFQDGDLIDLTTIAATEVIYDATARTLTLDNGPDTATVATLSDVDAAAGQLAATSDGHGGTLISYTGTPARLKYEIAGGDRAMRSDVVRSTMTVPGTTTAITGKTVRVGIISDSFDAVSPGRADTDAQNGYLPETADGHSAVTVLTEGSSEDDDEGRAMAELIYQVAPGADLDFAADGDTDAGFVSAVNALVQAGCNIIVDDDSFFNAPFYQVAGADDAAVTSAIAGGVNFFSAAGNTGDTYLEQVFAPQTATLADGTTAPAQIFSNGSPYERIAIQALTGTEIDLQWTAPYEGAGSTGAPAALTLKIFSDTGTYLGTATEIPADQVTTTDVYYDLPYVSIDTDYLIAVTLNTGAVSPDAFKLILTSFSGGTGPGGAIDDPQAGEGSGDINGHQLIPGVNSVGAMFYGNSAAFGQTPSFDEYFSSNGTGTLLYDSNGTPLASPENAGKVNFLAADGVNTPVPGFSGFYGTSAAAPNAAAVAALVLQANPNLTTTQVTDVLANSAISLGLSPAEQGAGFIQADQAVVLAEQVACYREGTRILTGHGERPVETLAAGDLVMGWDGTPHAIRWIGYRRYDGRFIAGNRNVLPIVIRAGALADGVPARDLHVSPKHAMLLDDALIAAELLVNGVSIVQLAAVASLTYYHVELDDHEVLLAEGAPSESFIDHDSRMMFQNAHAFFATHGASRPMEEYATRIEDGELLERVRARIAARAGLPADHAADAATEGPLDGRIDVLHEREVSGWAFDATRPHTPVWLEVLDGGQIIGRVLANRFRPDLGPAGLGDGRCSFVFRFWKAPVDPGMIAVRRMSDGVVLEPPVLRHVAA